MEITKYKEKIQKAYQNSIHDRYRLHYHLMPLSGTLADPNGLCYVDGTYHIYYVHSPIELQEVDRVPCVWGHYSTKDFIHYKCHPIAIYPDHERDRDGVYSGSMLVEDGIFYAYYTGNVRHQGNYDYVHQGREQNVMLVTSHDGIHFDHKQVLMTNDDFPEDMTQHVRDPQIFVDKGHYYMCLGARDINDQGCLLIYESDNHTDFHLYKKLSTPKKFGYMWECPDFFQLDGQWLLVVCPQGVPHESYRYQNAHQCGYFIVNDTIEHFEMFDYGFDFYAARTLLDDQGRRILIGWMGMPETHYGRTLTKVNNWDQNIALARNLIYKEGRVYQQPLEEYKRLRNQKKVINPKNGYCDQCTVFELILDIHKLQDIHIKLREDCFLSYDYQTQVLTLKMGLCGDGRDQRQIKVETLTRLHIFSDTSSLEVFINDGYATMSTRIFGESDDLNVFPFDGEMTLYSLKRFTYEEQN